MNSKLSVALSIFSLTLLSAAANAQKDIPNDAYKSWSKYKVGTTATLKTVTKMGGKAISQVKMVHKLLEKTDEKVVIEIATTVVVNGMEIKTPGNKMTHKKNVSNSFDKPANLPKNMKYKQTGKGSEMVKLGGSTYACKWISSTTEFQDIKTESKVWMSDSVPGMVVKMQVKTSKGVETETELVEIKKK